MLSAAVIITITLSDTVRQQPGGSYLPKYLPVTIHKINYISLAECMHTVINYMLPTRVTITKVRNIKYALYHPVRKAC